MSLVSFSKEPHFVRFWEFVSGNLKPWGKTWSLKNPWIDGSVSNSQSSAEQRRLHGRRQIRDLFNFLWLLHSELYPRVGKNFYKFIWFRTQLRYARSSKQCTLHSGWRGWQNLSRNTLRLIQFGTFWLLLDVKWKNNSIETFLKPDFCVFRWFEKLKITWFSQFLAEKWLYRKNSGESAYAI